MSRDRRPLAYFITYTCYGTRLHGSYAGSYKTTGFVKHNEGLEKHERRLMKQGSYSLDPNKATIALSAIRETAAFRNWNLLACHMDQTHVHVVVIADQKPERVMGDFKSYSSRALTKSGHDFKSRNRWTSGGSTQYLWNCDDIVQAVDYTTNRQNKPLASYQNPELLKILDTIT